VASYPQSSFMPAPLASVRVKLDRANNHARELKLKIIRYLNREPYRTTREHQPKMRQSVYRIYLKRLPPPEWSAILGDAVHNHRSALDHLACAIVETHGEVTADTSFPICITYPDFRSAWDRNIGLKTRRVPGLKRDLQRL
jgi:hypothetical protein